MTGNHRRYVSGLACLAVVALGAAACRPKPRPTTTTTTTTRAQTTTTVMEHDGGGMDHGHMPDKFNHPPTEQQKKDALAWVDATRAANQNLTVAELQRRGYIGIGDFQHYVKPEFTRDDKFLDPTAVESFFVRNGVAAAAMYVYNSKGLNTTVEDAPDIAGTWTMWHNHVLPYQSADPMDPNFFKLGVDPKTGQPHYRTDSPMIHVWITKGPNGCGPFASAGVGEGSCIKELANY
jgi:hypothetical protein